MDFKTLPAADLYSMAKNRNMYGAIDKIGNYIEDAWFLEPVYKHLTGKRLRYTKITDEERPFAEKAMEIMREFCALSDLEVEELLVSRSTLDAANYSIKVKKARLEQGPEREFLERCKGKKSRLNALLTYCGRWDIMPDNMTEITMIAGFEGGRRGRIGTNFIKKLVENKRKCRDLLSQIMKLEGIGEDEPIKRIMGRLG